MRRLLLTMVAAFAMVVCINAQQPGFEAVSIRANNAGPRAGSDGGWQGNTWRFTNVTARQIMTAAYGIIDAQIVGGPPWMTNDRFDVAAKVIERPNREVLGAMWLTLLKDRFHLTAHTERRQMNAMTLTVESRNGDVRNGLRKLPEGVCVPIPGKPRDPSCGASVAIGRYQAHGVTIEALIGVLRTTYNAAPFIADKTGLTGRYDVDLTFTPQPLLDSTPDGVPLATALRDQLGLRLEQMQVPVDVVVVDSISHPDPN